MVDDPKRKAALLETTALVSLLDAMTRHQVYLEGVKLWFGNQFAPALAAIGKLVTKALSGLSVDNLGDLTRAQLGELLRKLKTGLSDILSTWSGRIVGILKDFAAAETSLSYSIFTLIEKVKPTVPSAKAALTDVINTPIGGVGQTVKQVISQFAGSASQSIQNEAVKGYADKEKVDEVKKAILGTKSLNNRDGTLQKIFRQNQAVVNTVLQHASQTVQAGIASKFYDRYKWVAVLDSRTTDICRGRNGRIYDYGKGPLPPAHVNCRSKTVPVKADAAGNTPPTYYQWLIDQPPEVQDDMLGAADGKRLRAGRLKGEKFPILGEVKSLTPEQFKAKFNMITAPKEKVD